MRDDDAMMAPCTHPTTARVTLRPMRPHRIRSGAFCKLAVYGCVVCRHTWVYPPDVYHWLRPAVQQNLRRLAARRSYTWDEPEPGPAEIVALGDHL